MKKLMVILLALVLLVPAFAFAEDAPAVVTLQQWLDSQAAENGLMTVQVKSIINPVLAVVADDTAEVNLFGINIDGEFKDFYTAGIVEGDVLVLWMPQYNEYEGSVEMADSVLLKSLPISDDREIKGETVQVTTREELAQMLEDESVGTIEIVEDMTITESYLSLNKNVVILSDVVFKPAPDDGFFVKSLYVPEGVTLTVKGSLTTEHTFDTDFVIAQLLIGGGTLDYAEGSVTGNLNICFNDGEIIEPEGGFDESVEIACYLYDGDITEETIVEKLNVPCLRIVEVQVDCTVFGSIVVPEGKQLVVAAVLTVEDGGSIEGDVAISEECAVFIKGSGVFNGIARGEDAVFTVLDGMQDGTWTIKNCDADGNTID